MSAKDIFSNEDIPMSSSEFALAIKGLLDKGLVEEVIVDGEINYRLTSIGCQIGPHMTSVVKEQN